MYYRILLRLLFQVCEENFEKKCQITFKQQATTETVKKCYKPLKKVCNGQGPEQCRTVYESSCSTKYIEKQPGKFVGDTKCEKLPVEICGAGCVTEEQPEECHNKEVKRISITITFSFSKFANYIYFICIE